MKKNFLFLFNNVFIFFFVKCLNKSNKLYSKNINNISKENIYKNNNEIIYKNILNNNIIKYLDINMNNDNSKNNSKNFINEKIINLNVNNSNNSNNSDSEYSDNSDNSDSEEDKYLKCFPNKFYFILTIIVFGFIVIFVIIVSIYKYFPKKNNIEDEIQISFTDINQKNKDKILFNDK